MSEATRLKMEQELMEIIREGPTCLRDLQNRVSCNRLYLIHTLSFLVEQGRLVSAFSNRKKMYRLPDPDQEITPKVPDIVEADILACLLGRGRQLSELEITHLMGWRDSSKTKAILDSALAKLRKQVQLRGWQFGG
jgi:hypothetical protein